MFNKFFGINPAAHKAWLSTRPGTLKRIKTPKAFTSRQLFAIFIPGSTYAQETLEARMASASASAPASASALALSIPFTTTRAFWNQISSAGYNVLTFQGNAASSFPFLPFCKLIRTGVSFQDFTTLNSERDLHGRRIRFRRYNAQQQILIIFITGKPHERLHQNLYLEGTKLSL